MAKLFLSIGKYQEFSIFLNRKILYNLFELIPIWKGQLMDKKIKVMVVDDSLPFRSILSSLVSEHPDIQVIAWAELHGRCIRRSTVKGTPGPHSAAGTCVRPGASAQ